MFFSHTDILEMGEGAFFGPGNAQLPNSEMLMIDQITHISTSGGAFNRGKLDATFAVTPQQWFFPCHFKNDPVMPGCLGLDALWQLLGVFLGWSGLQGRGRALGVGNVKFSGQIFPDAGAIRYVLDIKRIITRPLAMGIADGCVVLDDKVIYRAENLKVGLLGVS
ncbi:MAG: bifunctional 3-hydroxydecanoyl-ACP dehydratase/trans-2-decenoyl-ACP isomerase [Agarilytica sp.]